MIKLGMCNDFAILVVRFGRGVKLQRCTTIPLSRIKRKIDVPELKARPFV